MIDICIMQVYSYTNVSILYTVTETQLRTLRGMSRGGRSTTTTSRTLRSTGTATSGSAIDSLTTASGMNTFHEWRHRITVRI